MTGITYWDENEIRSVVERFERCDFALPEFTHARHLTVACWYLCTLSPEEAMEQMRRGLQAFIAHHGKQGYHETITRFWMEILAGDLGRCPHDATLTEKINAALQRYSNKDVLYSFYSRDRVMSDEARAGWVEPDLRPISNRGVGAPEFRRILNVLVEGS